MSKMRNILIRLMDEREENTYDVYRKTGVHPATISRFLNGQSKDLKGETARKLARHYGISESQLRGDIPINDLDIPPDRHELRELLPRDEFEHVENVKKLDDQRREFVYRLAEMLVAEPKMIYNIGFEDRRKQTIYPNNQLRVGEPCYRPAQSKKRLQDLPDARKYNGHRKTSRQTA